MSVTFYFGLVDGIMKCSFTIKQSSVSHTVNGWHDGLTGLVVGACELLGHAKEATAYFQEEPGEFRWRMVRLEANRIRVRVIEFDDWGKGEPDEYGALLFDQLCGAVAFGRAIHFGASDFLSNVTDARESTVAAVARLGELLARYPY